MATLTLRSLKGSPLSNSEVDLNFTELNNELQLKLFIDDFNPSAVLTRLRTVDGTGSGLDADLLRGLVPSADPNANTVALRSNSGNLTANTFLATTGFEGHLYGDVTGDVSGTANNIRGIASVTNGGTGASTASQARTNLGLGNIATQNINAVNLTGGQITGMSLVAATNLTGYLTGNISGTSDNIRGIASVTNGGTGASTASGARVNLGLAIGTNVQQWSTTLDSLSSQGVDGLLGKYQGQVRNVVVSGGNNITVSGGDGKAANGTISVALNPSISLSSVSANSLVGTLTGDVVGNVSGNAGTSSRLQSPRTINGVNFDGTSNITVYDNTKLGAAGGTITGQLYLNNWPDSASAAARKDYVDSRIPNYICTSGRSAVYYPTNQVGWINWSYNYFDVFPPAGKTMANLVAFIPSIWYVFYAGGVDGNDILYNEYSYLSDRIRVWVGNSEIRTYSYGNWLAFWSN